MIADWLWYIWLAIFVVLESIALLNDTEGDTLSEKVRDWFSVRRQGKFARLRRLALIVFVVWLAVHFLVPGFV